VPRRVHAAAPDSVLPHLRGSQLEEAASNAFWCLPDGEDDDGQTDGCVRFGSVRDTSAEPSGFIFLASGEEASVSIQHRKFNDDHGRGAPLRISGFKVR
jgi:hypothetical protein